MACEARSNDMVQNGALQGNVMMRNPGMNFRNNHHSEAGIVAGITIVLVWVFLIFGIAAFAKWIFWGGSTVKKHESTNAS